MNWQRANAPDGCISLPRCEGTPGHVDRSVPPGKGEGSGRGAHGAPKAGEGARDNPGNLLSGSPYPRND